MNDKNIDIKTPQASRVIRMKELTSILGLAKSTIYDKLNLKSKRYDPSFPKPVKLGIAAVGWHLSEVTFWMQSLKSTQRYTKEQ